MSRDNVPGRPNKAPSQAQTDDRHTSDVASRMFTSSARGTAMVQPPPHTPGHSYNPEDPYQYAKDKGRGSISPRSKTNA